MIIKKRSIYLTVTLLVTTFGLVGIQENVIAQQRLTNRVQACLPSSGCLEDPKSPLALIIVNPPRGAIRELRPAFSWLPVEGANRYTVSLKSSRGLLWQVSNISGTELVYPEGKDRLESDKDYDLIIEANDPDETKGQVRFRTLNQEEIQVIESQIQLIRDRGSTSDETTLALAELYWKHSLVSDAIAILKEAVTNKTKSAWVYFNLGTLYQERLQAPSLAEPMYQKALALAQEPRTEDLILQAEAQIGLARVVFVLENEDWDRGILYLKNAYDNYMTAGDRKFEAAQVAHFLGEMYYRQEDISSAIQWYRIALESYKDLGKQEYVSDLEKILEDLE
jgi:tetratricopeptide (TPR) repeat protein